MVATYNKRIRMIAVDLDGTLFNSCRVVSDVTKQAVYELLALNNVKMIIASGRPYSSIIRLLDELEIDVPIICSGGSLMINGKEGKVMFFKEIILTEHIDQIINWVDENDVVLYGEYLHGGGLRYCSTRLNKTLTFENKKKSAKLSESKNPRIDFSKPFIKLSFRQSENKSISATMLNELFPRLNFVNSGYDVVDLIAKEASKGHAVKLFADQNGIELYEVAAIGDQTNDYSMLSIVGLPIAMGNAVDELKALAKWFAPTNDENGVAWALHKIIENNAKNS